MTTSAARAIQVLWEDVVYGAAEGRPLLLLLLLLPPPLLVQWQTCDQLGWTTGLVVYRLRADGVIYYLRIAEETGQDLTTDAQVLPRLAGQGVRVPAVVHAEARPGDLDRSFLIVSAVAGAAWPAMERTSRRVGRCWRPGVMPP